MASWHRLFTLLLALVVLCTSHVVADDATPAVTPATEVQAKTNHILVDTEAEADHIIELLGHASNILAEFARIAQDKSKCPSASKGGFLGYIKRGQMVPEFEAAVFDQPPRHLYKVKTQFGWHVIYTIRFGQRADEEADEDSWSHTFKVLLLKASPFLSPILLVIIFFCGQRSSNKLAGPKARASHILVKTEAEADALLKEIEKATDKKKKLAELAAAKSTCPSGRKGGDLGLFGKGQMVPAFEKVAFEKEVGSIHKVQTQFGWHLVMVTDRLGAATKKNN